LDLIDVNLRELGTLADATGLRVLADELDHAFRPRGPPMAALGGSVVAVVVARAAALYLSRPVLDVHHAAARFGRLIDRLGDRAGARVGARVGTAGGRIRFGDRLRGER